MKKNYEFTEDRFEELPDDADIDAPLESLPEIGKAVINFTILRRKK